MWPSVAKIVAENRLGTAYASMFTVQNWGLGLFFWGIGALLIAIPVNTETKAEIDEVRMEMEVTDSQPKEEVMYRLDNIIEVVEKRDDDFAGSIDQEFLMEIKKVLMPQGVLPAVKSVR